jgi:hypothetical protein
MLALFILLSMCYLHTVCFPSFCTLSSTHFIYPWSFSPKIVYKNCFSNSPLTLTYGSSQSTYDLYNYDDYDLLCCYLFHGLCGQVFDYVLCFGHGFFELPLYNGLFLNNPDHFLLSGSKSLLQDLLLVLESLHFDV